MSELLIDEKGLTKFYKDKCAINELNIQIQQGEIYGLIGPNGVGKVTTIEFILGTKKRDRGEVSVLGSEASRHVTL